MRQVVIVTGASRGIGAATATLAAARGYAVCVNYLRSREPAERVVTDIRAAKAAGAQSLSVLCGFGLEAELRRAGTQKILPTTSDLVAYLTETRE